MTYIRTKHSGLNYLSKQYNKALAECKSPLVAILEGDDYWPRSKLERQLSRFESSGCVLSYGVAGLVGARGEKIGRPKRFPRNTQLLCNEPRGRILQRLIIDCFIPSPTVMIRRDALDQVGGFRQAPGSLAVDFFTYFHLSFTGKFLFLPMVLGYSRRHPGAASSRPTLEHWNITIRYAINYLKSCNERDLSPRYLNSIIDHERDYFVSVERYNAFSNARTSLLKGQWASARRQFRNLLRCGSGQIESLSIVGLVGAYLHFNVESLLNLSLGVFPLSSDTSKEE